MFIYVSLLETSSQISIDDFAIVWKTDRRSNIRMAYWNHRCFCWQKHSLRSIMNFKIDCFEALVVLEYVLENVPLLMC